MDVYQRVRLLSDRFASSDDVKSGAIGYVIEVYPDGNCEVEFSNENGITYAEILAKPNELEITE